MPFSPIDGTYLAIAAPFLAAVAAPSVRRVAGGYAGWLLTVLLGVWPAILMSIADRSVAALLSP